jgi:hypothetical protein
LPDYSHRDVLDKLGINPGHSIAFVEAAGPLDAGLRERVLERAGRPPAGSDEAANMVLATVDSSIDVVLLLKECKARIKHDGGIWLLTPKRGFPGYIDQRELIEAGSPAGLVDNKSCSVSDTTSGMRFVIRKADRPA